MLNVNLPIRPGLLITETPDTPADRVAEKRRIRKHQVLDIIRRQGPVPRVEIARTLGFNLPSVSSLVDELVSEGLASEDKAKRTPIGRRPIPVSFNPEAASIIGIDVGKTSTIGLLMDLGIALFTGALIFQVITVPVELNASRRAVALLEGGGYLAPEETEGAWKVLSAAAWTYVAAALVALLQLVRLLALRSSRDD
jgi:Zn-dependent membrane protease YugP